MTDVHRNKDYYDEFSRGYDRGRSEGYHKLIDDQAAAIVRRVGEGMRVLEVGCGTGLVLARVSEFARAEGIDLSPGMLEHARARGLSVREGSATSLPFDDASFDVAYSFKVLAHVDDLTTALREMSRVVRPGGHLVFDLYNRNSLRYWIKRLWGPRATSSRFDESAVLTRFSTIDETASALPPGTRLHRVDGIRIVTMHSAVYGVPGVASAFAWLEWRLMPTPMARFAGFPVLTVERTK